jgi:hypothetical protein
MGRVVTWFMPRLGTVCLCCAGLSVPTLAAPPFGKTSAPARPVTSAENTRFGSARPGSENHSSIASGTSRFAHLDLRPPLAGEFAASAGKSASETVDMENEPRRFPSAHRGDMGRDDQDSLQPPSIAAGHARIMGNVEAFTRRLHREGLPVARLWENHSAFLSLGLNQRGKPGLWLVQKTH